MRNKRIRDLCIFLGYALCFAALREISAPQWFVSTGFRLGTLLLLPVDFWPAIVLADVAGTILYKYNGLHLGNLNWFFWAAIAPSFIAPIAASALRALRWNGPNTTHTQSACMVLTTTLLMSAAYAGAGDYAFSLIHFGEGPEHVDGGPLLWFSVYFIGHYLGSLMVVPWIMTYHWNKRGRLLALIQDVRRSGHPVKMELGVACAVICVLMCINAGSGDRDVQYITSALMALPIIIVAMRRGWVAAVILSFVSNLAIRLTLRDWYEPSVVVEEIALGSLITIVLGAAAIRTELLSTLLEFDRERYATKDLARQNLTYADSMLRRSVMDLEKEYRRMAERNQGRAEEDFAMTAAASAEARWSMGVSPSIGLPPALKILQNDDLDVRGLKMGLGYGTVANCLRTSGIFYSHAISPSSGNLPRDMEILLVRLTNEMVLAMCHRYKPYRVAVKLRVLNHAGRVVALRIKVWPGNKDISKLPGPCLYIENVRPLAQTFNGKVLDRTYLDDPSVTIFLRDL